MPVFQPSVGMPGISAEKIAKHRTVGADGYLEMLPGGGIIDVTKTRDVFNTDDVTRLEAGLLMGKVTSSGKWAASFFGVTQGAYTSGGTSLTLTAAQATELVRRVGASGTFNLIGPATAGGSVSVTTVTYSAVDTGTGVVTITNIGANRVAGCLVGHPSDGSHLPASFLPDGWEVPLPADLTSDIPFDKVPIEGNVDGSNLLPWPADSALKQWVRDQLNAYGKFVFTEKY